MTGKKFSGWDALESKALNNNDIKRGGGDHLELSSLEHRLFNDQRSGQGPQG